MKTPPVIFIFPAVIAILSAVFFKNHDPGDEIIEAMKQWYKNHPQEKVFVQTDRDKYAAGETIWLKAWCALYNKPSFLSKVVYVVLTDANGIVADKKMYQLDSLSSAKGLIDLDKNLKTGNYNLNAYTLWMLNYPNFVFQKRIYIYGNDYTTSNIIKQKINEQLSFFPEGGDMIEGVNGRIAYKAVNSSGFPLKCTGTIYTDAGEKITDIETKHEGMGVLELQPAVNINYIAKVSFENGRKAEYKLPVAKKEGIAIQVQNSSSRISIVLNRGLLNNEKYNNLFVVAQINGAPVYKANFNIDAGEAGGSIMKKNLPAGIMQITVFDSTGLPLAERLTFIDNYLLATPKVSPTTFTSTRRGKNVLSFLIDSVTSPDLSALVLNNSIDASIGKRDNILSSFLLCSDIKGYIQNPGYYFANKEPATLQNLDMLLMTQGWRRFNWKQVRGEEQIVLKYAVESSMNISGKVTKSGRSETVKEGLVTAIIKTDDSTTILSNAFITDKGEFIIDSLKFRNNASVSYEGTDNKKNKLPVDVAIYPVFIDTLKKSTYRTDINPDTLFLTPDDSYLSAYLLKNLFLADSNDRTLLTGVTIKTKKLSKIDSLQKDYVSMMYERSDQTLAVQENQNYFNIWQFLNANVPGLYVNPFQAGGVTYASFARYDGLSLADGEQSIKFLLNEMPVPIEAIDGLTINDVALIKVYKGATGFPFGAEAGAISIYTKKGRQAEAAVFDKNFSKIEKQGYAYTREFYEPDYTIHPGFNKNITDRRPVLYWNPRVQKNKSGNYTIEFYNDDEASAFKLIIQGIDRNGKFIYKELVLK